jgi:hypothetical protein
MSKVVMSVIQSVSGLVDITAGGDFLGLCDQKSLYKHVSDFGRLRSYGHFLIPVHTLVWTALTDQLAGDVHGTYLGGLSFALQTFFPPVTPTQLQTVQFPYLDTWKVFKECGEGGVGGYSPGQCMLYDSATTACSKTLITYNTVTVPAPNVQNNKTIDS